MPKLLPSLPMPSGLTLRRNKYQIGTVPSGGQIGNKNAARDPKEVKGAVLNMRCRRADKAAWVRATNRAIREGKLGDVAGSKLAAWVILSLNAAADAELGTKDAALRLRDRESRS